LLRCPGRCQLAPEQIWTLILGWTGVGVTALGYMLARRGKKKDEQSADVEDAWTRLNGEVA
jgi:hypothetical protein